MADGSPIVLLPPRSTHIEWLLFTPEERDFYDAIATHSKVRFDAFVSQGRVLNQYAQVLAMLMQMRQACDHPFLVLSRADGNHELGRFGATLLRRWREQNGTSSGGEAFIASTVSQLQQLQQLQQGRGGRGGASRPASASLPGGSSRSSTPVEVEGGDGGGATGAVGADGDAGADTDGAVAAADVDGLCLMRCAVCLDSFEEPVVTPCAHTFCRECILSCLGSLAAAPCPVCREAVRRSALLAVPLSALSGIDAFYRCVLISSIIYNLFFLSHLIYTFYRCAAITVEQIVSRTWSREHQC